MNILLQREKLFPTCFMKTNIRILITFDYNNIYENNKKKTLHSLVKEYIHQ